MRKLKLVQVKLVRWEKLSSYRHKGKPKMALLVAKVPFWEGAWKGALLSVIPKSCALLKTLFIVFSAKHSFAEIKERNLKNKKKYQKWGVFANMQKGVFFVCVFVVWWFCFSLYVLFSLFGEKTKGNFPAILESFSFFFLVCYFSGFPFVFPFKTPFFLCFLSINPFLENINIFGFFIFLFSCLFLS